MLLNSNSPLAVALSLVEQMWFVLLVLPQEQYYGTHWGSYEVEPARPEAVVIQEDRDEKPCDHFTSCGEW